tara:strand:+ start:1330 stop:1833 length:504 start_codon:yes stop_codon:yes gene_type:complete
MKDRATAHKSCAALSLNYQYESIYSNCAHSSDLIQSDDLPRTCSLGLFGSTPVWRDCSKCEKIQLQKNTAEELWPDSEYTQLMIRSELEARKEFVEKQTQAMAKPDGPVKQSKPGCSKCQAAKKPMKSRGLGDTIAKITHKLGIKQCKSCKRRQKQLNRKFRYGKDN